MNKDESTILQDVHLIKMREKTIKDSRYEDKIITVAAGSTENNSDENFEIITVIEIEGHGPTAIEYGKCGNALSIRLRGDTELNLIIEAFKSVVEILKLTLPQDTPF